MQLKVIKQVDITVSSVPKRLERAPKNMDAFSDRAYVDMRGFYSVAWVHTSRTEHPGAINAMLEMVENLRANLLLRKVIDKVSEIP